jgi:hypothetical protein
MKTAIRMGALVVATAISGFTSVAVAQDKPCMADAARLCPDVEPGGGAQMQCLKAHKEQLSPACKKKVMSAKMKHEEQEQMRDEQKAAPQPTPEQMPQQQMPQR